MMSVWPARSPLMCVLVVLLLLPGFAGAQPDPVGYVPVGHARMVVRSVFGVVAESRRPIAVEDAVFWQELIETGAESAARLVFNDGTVLSTGPGSTVRIDEFVVPGPGGERGLLAEVARGLIRFISGSAPPPAYLIRTPSALVAVRGTDFVVSVDEVGETRVAVTRGEVVLTSLEGATAILRPGQSSRVAKRPDAVPSQPGPPEPDIVAASAELTALIVVAGKGDRGDAIPGEDAKAVSAQKAQAASQRAGTPASQSGSRCGGC